MSENEISYRIIGCAIKIHQTLGPGLLESAYEACLYYELLKVGLFVERQKPIPLIHEQVKLDCGYRADLVVEKKLVVEVKAVEALNEIHLMQTLTHIKLLDYRLGLLVYKTSTASLVNHPIGALQPIRCRLQPTM